MFPPGGPGRRIRYAERLERASAGFSWEDPDPIGSWHSHFQPPRRRTGRCAAAALGSEHGRRKMGRREYEVSNELCCTAEETSCEYWKSNMVSEGSKTQPGASVTLPVILTLLFLNDFLSRLEGFEKPESGPADSKTLQASKTELCAILQFACGHVDGQRRSSRHSLCFSGVSRRAKLEGGGTLWVPCLWSTDQVQDFVFRFQVEVQVPGPGAGAKLTVPDMAASLFPSLTQPET
ncbi:hypothetical protein BDP67DRAFT_567268 [Colletotrichum lupini]|nr:hypothetical protein BDP67DRAFT_567268 [Colletotrichum lupini]